MDSRKYEIEYIDGHTKELTANLIAENMIAHVDEERSTPPDDAVGDHGSSLIIVSLTTLFLRDRGLIRMRMVLSNTKS
jgi:hypothetical protein